ncbi:unnamed protein product [Mucor hiemalis]
MPNDADERTLPNTEQCQEQDSESQYAQYYVEEDISEYEDEEQEYAYKCDFKKREPPNRSSNNNCASLLSNLFSGAPVPIQNCTKNDHNNQSKPISIQRPEPLRTTASDPLSESLKRNVEWEHTQSPLEKYRNSKKTPLLLNP